MNSKKLINFKYIKHLLSGKNVPYILGVTLVVIIALGILPNLLSVTFDATHMKADVSSITSSSSNQLLGSSTSTGQVAPAGVFDPNSPIIYTLPGVTHIKTPAPLKAVYMSSWVAGSNDLKNKIKKLIGDTELNAVVIDFKDSTGKLSAETGVPAIDNEGCIDHRIKDIKGLIKELHDQDIYVIARVAVFQDSCLTGKHPEYAVKTKSTGNVWKDRKGMSWMYAGSKEVWDYNIKIARVAYSIGFDEVNLDYIRFPSDGNMKDISYPVNIVNDPVVVKPKIQKSTSTASTTAISAIASSTASSSSELSIEDTTLNTRANILSRFFTYVDNELRKSGDNRPKISADVFGMVATNYDDLGIGQILEKILPHVDYIAPMVYPSHFASGWNGFAKPAIKPYEVINISMTKAIKRAKAIGQDPKKIRPWLQDFNLGAIYTAQMVQAQIKGDYDAGLDSWMMWDPANRYTSTKQALIN